MTRRLPPLRGFPKRPEWKVLFYALIVKTNICPVHTQISFKHTVYIPDKAKLIYFIYPFFKIPHVYITSPVTEGKGQTFV